MTGVPEEWEEWVGLAEGGGEERDCRIREAMKEEDEEGEEVKENEEVKEEEDGKEEAPVKWFIQKVCIIFIILGVILKLEE